jgi:hypothetical protein
MRVGRRKRRLHQFTKDGDVMPRVPAWRIEAERIDQVEADPEAEYSKTDHGIAQIRRSIWPAPHDGWLQGRS